MTLKAWLASCAGALLLQYGCSDPSQPHDLVDAEIQVTAPVRDTIDVKFDLAEYRISATNTYASPGIPGIEFPPLQFLRREVQTLSVAFHFDSREDGRDVRLLTSRITSLMKMDATLHAPPILRFVWKDFEFPCVIGKIDETYLSIFDNGNPSRAKLAVTLLRYSTLQIP